MTQRAALLLSAGLIALAASNTASADMTPPAAESAKAVAKTPTKLNFITPDLLNPVMTVPAPYAAETPEGKAELEIVRQAIAMATPERIALAARDDAAENAGYISDVVPGFDLAKLPVTKALFDKIRTDENAEAKLFKAYFDRPRPFEVDPTIKICAAATPTPAGKTHGSYPSGHATLGFSMGIILAHLMPEKANTILKRARTYAESRVICGHHFPSDTVASQAISTAIATEMLHNPDFQTEFKAARAELVTAGLTQP